MSAMRRQPNASDGGNAMAKTLPLPHYRAVTQSSGTSQSRPWWTTMAYIAAGIAAVQLGTRAFLWFLPYHVAGFVNELALFALAALLGLALYLVRRQRASPPPARQAVVVASVLYLLASAAGLGWSSQSGLGLGAHDYALFSTPGCDFAARFESPPRPGRVKGVLNVGDAKGEPPLLYVAVLADVATATAFRAECLPLPTNSDPRVVAQNLVSGLGRWADELALDRRRSGLRDDPRGPIFAIDGDIRGSILPEQDGKAARTLVGLRSYVGPNSVMMVYVFQPQGDALSQQSLDFLDGVRRR
jgi:hypothetical protein